MQPNLNKLLKKERALFLAYDQGLEHGPVDFNEKNCDPLYILDIAKCGGYQGIVFHKGIAEKYYEEIKKSKVPLILKLNGKTRLVNGEPISEKICSVEKAIELGAFAVGYTIYIGSEFESEIFQEFADIQEEAHKKGLPVIAWIYPRGKSVEKMNKGELMIYACRVGLELGADIIKIQYNGNLDDLKWAVKCAGKAKVVVAGGTKADEKQLLKQVRDIMKAGCIGLAIGRNIWQSENPIKITEKINKIVWNN